MKRPGLLLLFSSLVVFSLNAQQINTSPFVRVIDTRLILNGKPYIFCGTNFWYGCFLGSKGKTCDRERLKRELDMLMNIGIKNLRILASGEESTIKNSLKPSFQISPGVYNEEMLDGLDYLLSEMGKRHMTGVLYLNNYWQWTGGMEQYLLWVYGKEQNVGNKDNKTKIQVSSADFYANKEANKIYRNYIKMLVNRKNNYSGKFYKDDPAIMAWQLANEPRGGDKGYNNVEAYYLWIDSTAAYIHSLDKNHLVSTGSEGTIGSGDSPLIFQKAHQSKNIDYLTFHLWAKNWDWFDSGNFDLTEKNSETRAAGYVNDHINMAQLIGKPVVMEEFGLDRDSSKCMPGTPATARNRYYRFVYNLIAEKMKGNTPMMGTNFWGWAGEAVPSSPDGKVSAKSPFLADPWQEPQGLNSVFASDSATIKIIKEHARLVNDLFPNN